MDQPVFCALCKGNSFQVVDEGYPFAYCLTDECEKTYVKDGDCWVPTIETSKVGEPDQVQPSGWKDNPEPVVSHRRRGVPAGSMFGHPKQHPQGGWGNH